MLAAADDNRHDDIVTGGGNNPPLAIPRANIARRARYAALIAN